jgi:hypothetical protein
VSIFEAIKIADTLEEAVRDTLMAWFKTYLREFELQASLTRDVLPEPRTITIANDLDQQAANQLPAVVIVSPGLSPRNRPKQEGDGSFRVWLAVGIGVFASGASRQDTAKLIRYYTAIIRTIILQHQSLGGVADGCEWFDESYDDAFNFSDEETVGAGQVVFEFEVAGVVNRYGGPAAPFQPEPAPDPDTQPGSNWPVVQKVTATVEAKES